MINVLINFNSHRVCIVHLTLIHHTWNWMIILPWLESWSWQSEESVILRSIKNNSLIKLFSLWPMQVYSLETYKTREFYVCIKTFLFPDSDYIYSKFSKDVSFRLCCCQQAFPKNSVQTVSQCDTQYLQRNILKMKSYKFFPFDGLNVSFSYSSPK